MPLTTEEMQQIVTDTVTGQEQRVSGKEADSFRKELGDDIALAEKNEWVIDIPPEWEVATEEEPK